MAHKGIVYNGHTFDLSYEILNPKSKIDCIILHGWGSNKALMKQTFKDTLPQMRHIYIDLPGFGNSTAPIPLNSYDYANILELLFESIKVSKKIIVGHSFGGKVATLLQPEVLVLLSSAGIYLPKPLHVRLKIGMFKLLKHLGLAKLREYFVADDAKKLSAEMYETFKTVVNEDFLDEFKKFPNDALIFWGISDTATPLIAGEMIAEAVKKSRFYSYEGDHYFFIQHKRSIALEIEKFYSSLEK